MYRPKKKQFVRRAAVTSSLALVAVTGLGVTLMSQSGASSTALKAQKATTAAATSTTKTAGTTLTIAGSKYHIVGGHHDDAHRSVDGSRGVGDN